MVNTTIHIKKKRIFKESKTFLSTREWLSSPLCETSSTLPCWAWLHIPKLHAQKDVHRTFILHGNFEEQLSLHLHSKTRPWTSKAVDYVDLNIIICLHHCHISWLRAGKDQYLSYLKQYGSNMGQYRSFTESSNQLACERPMWDFRWPFWVL